jgi:hypothetical protein
MSMTVRENDVDLDALPKVPKFARQRALAHLTIAQRMLAPLRKGFPEGTSPTILRAIQIAIDALEDSLTD